MNCFTVCNFRVMLAAGSLLMLGTSALLADRSALPALRSPFTMTYSVSGWESKAGHTDDLQGLKNALAWYVANHVLSKEEADRQLANKMTMAENEAQQPLSRQSGLITISYDGRRFLYICRGVATSVFLFDEKRSIQCDGKPGTGSVDSIGRPAKGKLLSMTLIDPGFREDDIRGLFCPGVDLPGTLFFKDPSAAPSGPSVSVRGEALLIGAVSQDQKDPGVYLPATLTYSSARGPIKAERINLYATAQHVLARSIQFTGHRLFEGAWLPSRVVATEYLGPSEIRSVRIYNLVSCSDAALSVDNFALDKYISRGTIVQDNTHNPAVTIAYDPSKGSVDSQITYARNALATAPALLENGRAPSRDRSGLLALLGIGFAVAAWIIRRRRLVRAI